MRVLSYSYSVVLLRAITRVCVFFFQAEDGIRDLVRSRGLGDVYKRQARRRQNLPAAAARPANRTIRSRRCCYYPNRRPGSVSYTHLTLPTSDLV